MCYNILTIQVVVILRSHKHCVNTRWTCIYTFTSDDAVGHHEKVKRRGKWSHDESQGSNHGSKIAHWPTSILVDERASQWRWNTGTRNTLRHKTPRMAASHSHREWSARATVILQTHIRITADDTKRQHVISARNIYTAANLSHASDRLVDQ